MTRFANIARFVFFNLRVDYSTLRLALVSLIASKEKSNVIKDRSKLKEIKYV